MIEPIKPKDISSLKLNIIPDEVIEIFNSMIIEKWTGSSAIIYQSEIVNRISEKLEISRESVFNRHYLDVEDIFQNAGWKVVYDKPAYFETYEAYFEFRER